jgi:hypothetical protein
MYDNSPKTTYEYYDFYFELSKDELYLLSNREIKLPHLWKLARAGEAFEDIIGVRTPPDVEREDIDFVIKNIIQSNLVECPYTTLYEFSRDEMAYYSKIGDDRFILGNGMCLVYKMEGREHGSDLVGHENYNLESGAMVGKWTDRENMVGIISASNRYSKSDIREWIGGI